MGSLRGELKEAMVAAEEGANAANTARRIRTEAWVPGTDLVTREVLNVAQAVLSVCDEYEEVEVQKPEGSLCLLRTRGNTWWESHKPSFTVYRKKEKLEPTLEELVRRAVKAWKRRFGEPPTRPLSMAMTALAEAVDK